VSACVKITLETDPLLVRGFLRGWCTARGDLRGVLEVHERCRQYERVRIEEVVLHLGGSPQGGN